jgi:hypothetical protein
VTTATVSRAFAAAAALTALASAASAQTVIVRSAAPSAPIELLLNADTVASATADSTGIATLTTDVVARLQRTETGIHLSVDSCGEQRRILLVEAGVTAPPQGACSRATVRDLFSVQRITTFVVDVGGANPVVWIRQGPAPRDWLGDRESTEQSRTWTPAPVGLIVSAGVVGASFSDFETKNCGDASSCAGGGIRVGGAAGVGFWVTPWLGLDIGVMRLSQPKVSASSTSLTFNTALDPRVVTIDGKAGTQVGPARIYGLGGVNHLSAATTTTQTVVASTVGNQTFGFKAEGWSWLAGGGVEMWLKPRIGIYFEGVVLSLSGTAIDNGQGTIDDRLVYGSVGVRVAFGHKR